MPCPCGIFMKTESVDRRKIKINLGWSGNDFPLTFLNCEGGCEVKKRDEGNSTSFGIQTEKAEVFVTALQSALMDLFPYSSFYL